MDRGGRPAGTVFAALIASIAAASARADVPGIVRQTAASQLEALQVIETAASPSPLRWASWQVGATAAAHSVGIALLRRGAGGATETWSATRKDGYDPRLATISNWPYEGRPTLMFVYQMGAEAAELELYGLNRRDQPVRLGTASGAAFFTRYGEEFQIEARGLLDEPARCLSFDPVHSKLAEKPCPR